MQLLAHLIINNNILQIYFLFIIQDRLAYDIKQTINNNESINELER